MLNQMYQDKFVKKLHVPRVRFLSVIPSMDPRLGGPVNGIIKSIDILRRFEVEREVVCLDNEEESYVKNKHFKIHALGKAKTAWHYNPKLEKWLEQNLSNYDYVIVHGLWLYHSYAVRKVFEKLKNNTSIRLPRLYVMPHGMLDPWFQKSPTRRLKAIRNDIYWHLIEKKLIKQADCILYTSEGEQSLAKETFTDYLPQKTQVIGYGTTPPPSKTLEMENAFYEKIPALKSRRFFLFLGRIDVKKGILELLQSYKEACNSLVDKEIPALLIVGPGLDTTYGNKISSYINEHTSLKANVFTLDMLEGQSKWGAFYCANFFILTSYQENFGISVVEALSCGCPVLLSDQVNIWKNIVEAKAGYSTSLSKDEIVNKILQVCALSEDEISILRINALKIFHEEFNLIANLHSMKDL